MKKGLIVLLVVSVLVSCGKEETIKFCEGMDQEGQGVNCGTKFETGDLTAVIKVKEPFGVTKLTVRVLDTRRDNAVIETVTVNVKEEDLTASANLRLYNSGVFNVEVLKDKNVISQGKVEMVSLWKGQSSR